MSRVLFLKPVVIDGESVSVFLPGKSRNIDANGENVIVDAYIEGRIRCGSLVVSEIKKTKKQESKK